MKTAPAFGLNQFGGQGGFNLFGQGVGFSSNFTEFDPDAIAYFNEVSPALSYRDKVIYNNLIKGLKADTSLTGTTSNWDEIDALWIFHAPSVGAYKVNIKYPQSDLIESVNGTWPAFSKFGGVQSISYNNSVNGMLNLKWNVSDNAVAASQNSFCAGAWMGTNTTDANNIFGGINASAEGVSMTPRTNTSGRQTRSNSLIANSPAANVTTSEGLHVDVRRNATQFQYWRDGVVRNTISRNSALPVAIDIYALVNNNNNGTPDRRTTRNLKMIFFGSGEIAQLSFYNRILTCLEEFGYFVPVYTTVDTMGFSNGDTLGFNSGDELGIGSY